jgi:hypothetical protein
MSGQSFARLPGDRLILLVGAHVHPVKVGVQ